MSLKKTRAFLEYYAKAAKGVPAGVQAEEALEELAKVELMAKRLNDAGYVDTMLEERRFDSGNTLRAIAENAP